MDHLKNICDILVGAFTSQTKIGSLNSAYTFLKGHIQTKRLKISS